MQPIFCMIIPMSGGGNYPDNSLPGQPPFPSQGPGFPTNPIAPGGQPPGIWGGRPPWVDNTLPGQQPGISHPIAPGGRPPGIWGGAPSYPDQGLPGQQPGVSPPIYLPPEGQPPGIWGGAPPWIDNTLPELPTETPDPDNRPIEWKAGWSSQTGWVVVGIPQGPSITPSK